VSAEEALQGRAIFLAPAKINLSLRVLGKRADGYHDLVTRMQKLDLCDVITMTVSTGKGVSLTCSDSELAVDESNLALRAAGAFLEKSSRLGGCRIDLHLEKNIPIAAGLGGGSSDAGTVLRGLNFFAGEEFSETDLVMMARPLGADVPFFAVPHSAVVAEGIGDRMYPVDSLSNCSFVLINPDFFVSTAWVFQKLSLTSIEKNSKVPRFQKRKISSFNLADMYNDLEQVTSDAYPEIDRMKESLLAIGASRVLMSGSGPTVFGVFPNTEKSIGSDLERVVNDLRQEYGNKVFLSKVCTGAWPSGKAPGFDPGIRRFESCRPSHQ
jgi:4-diphosphocytidyl-2-C-methyl-D-erythritol kinase